MKQIPGQLYRLKEVAWGIPVNTKIDFFHSQFLAGTIVLLVRSANNERLCLVGENLFWFGHKTLGALEP